MRYYLFLLLLGCNTYIPIEKNEDYIKRRTIAENEVSNWIKKYAKYPDSYESISFSEYEEFYTSENEEKIPNTENYKINHTHRILTKDSVIETFEGYFIMEYDYFVSIIENEKSNSVGGAFPPQIEVWMERYGRTLNQQDSIELEKRGEIQSQKIMNELRDALENGEVESDSPEEDKEMLKNILDSAMKK